MGNSTSSSNLVEPTDYSLGTAPKKVLGLPMSEYLQTKALNSGILAAAKKSLLHYKHSLTAPDKDSPAKQLGRLAHTLTFEASKFHSDYVVNKFSDKRSAAYREWSASLPEGLEVINAEQYGQAESIASAVRSHPMFSKISSGAMYEVSMFWSDEITGVRCKARFDLLNENLCLVADLKTTADAGVKAFSRQCMTMGYANKAAWYAAAYEAIMGERLDSFLYLAAEKEAPFACCFYRVQEDLLRHGETENRFLLHAIADAEKSQSFRGYSSEIVDLGLPDFAELELPEAH